MPWFLWSLEIFLLKTKFFSEDNLHMTSSVAGCLMMLSLTLESNSVSKTEPCKTSNLIRMSDSLLEDKARWFRGCQRGFEVHRSVPFQPVTSWSLWGVRGSTELRHLSWFLAPRGIACMETRRLMAEPQASPFSHGEMILLSKTWDL